MPADMSDSIRLHQIESGSIFADLNLTPGTIDRGASIAYPALGIELSKGAAGFRRAILELGLASETRGARGRRARVMLRAVFGPARSSARLLPSGVGPSAGFALGHYARSLRRAATYLLAIAMAGLATGMFSIVGVTLGASLFGLALVVHELGHVVAYRLLDRRNRPAIMVARGVRCHLVRASLAPGCDLLVALAGPLAPAAIIPLFAPLAWLAPWGFHVWLAISLGHAVSVLFPAGDGATVWAAARDLCRPRA